MKKLFFSLLLMLASLSMYSQTTTSHTVQRGETVESVANKYGITVADLQQANPDIKEFFYVGMKLTIPKVIRNNNQIQQEVYNGQNATTSNTTEPNTHQGVPAKYYKPTTEGLKYVFPGDEGSFEGKTYNVCFDLAYVLGAKQDGLIGTPWGMLISAGVNFRITDSFYAGVRLGYMYQNSDFIIKTNFEKMESTTNSLVLPLEIGYSISTDNKKFAITPVAGLMPIVCLSGKSKYMGEEGKVDSGKLTMAYNAGIRIRLWEYVLSAQYIFQKTPAVPGKSSEIKGTPMFSIGWGF